MLTAMFYFLALALFSAQHLSSASPVNSRRHHRRSASSVTTSTTVFPELIGADPWSEVLGNPCNAEPTPSAYTKDEVLNITGRVRDIKSMAGNTLAVLRQLQSSMTETNCSGHSLNSLPEELIFSQSDLDATSFSLSDLKALYTQFYFLSAHFHFIKRDWKEGRVCARTGQVSLETARLSRTFQRGMCLLMDAADPSPLAAPYPTARMLREHTEAAQNNSLYHYRDCSGREMRDCIVMGHAVRLMELVYAKAALVVLALEQSNV